MVARTKTFVIMDYEQKYKEAIERAKRLHSEPTGGTERIVCEQIFPELKESEDERIRKGLIKAISGILKGNTLYGTDVTREEAITWLEKQGEQKSAVIIPKFRVGDEIKTSNEGSLTITKIDEKGYWSEDLFICDFDKECIWDLVGQKSSDKVEPKFKVGDWVTDGYIHYKITEILYDRYIIESKYSRSAILFEHANRYHLWTIKDAKDGDVLVNSEGYPFIFSGKYDEIHLGNPIAYCGVTCENKFKESYGTHWTSKNGVTPATKEQRDLLFQKMAEAGYEWDNDKKELKKIGPKTLDPDKVMEWLECDAFQSWGEPIDIRPIIRKFKKDFGL